MTSLTANNIDASKFQFRFFYNSTEGSFGDVTELRLQAALSSQAKKLATSGDVDEYYDKLGSLYKIISSGGAACSDFMTYRADLFPWSTAIYKYNSLNSRERQAEKEACARIISTTNNLKGIFIKRIADGPLIVVPHSQGNFYTEAAYGLLKYERYSDITKIRVVGVAAIAMHPIGGKHVTIEQDNALYLLQALNTEGILNSEYSPAAPSFIGCVIALGCNGTNTTNADPERIAIAANSQGIDLVSYLNRFDGMASVWPELRDYLLSRIPAGTSYLLHEFIPIYLNDKLGDWRTGTPLPKIISNFVISAAKELGINDPTASKIKNSSNGHTYEVITCGTWSQCRDAAAAKGGSLVTIRSQAENDWLMSTFGASEFYWIGAYYDGIAKELKWVSGEPFVYQNWGPNQNGASVNGYPEEYCTHLFKPTPGFWNDVVCNYPDSTKAIVEYLPNGYQGKISWDLAGDFTTRQNGTGAWGFGYQPNGTRAMSLYLAAKSNCSDLGLTCWMMSSTAPDIPLVGANLSDNILVRKTIRALPNAVVLHPGMNGESSVVAWTAPTAGMYRLRATFQSIDAYPTGVSIWVETGNFLSPYSLMGGMLNFDRSMQLAKGQTVYFAVAPNGTYENDSTALSLTITKSVGDGLLTVLANTIPGATLTVPVGASSCAFTSTGTWSAGPNAPPEYQNADGVIGTNTLNLTNFGVPMPTEPIMALVVKHSSTGKWDLLGSRKTISVIAGETLSFMMNDATTFGYTDGNTGQLSTVWACN